MPKDKRNIQVIKDLDGKNIVIINDIIFKGKRHINWKDVEAYLKKYIGEFYEVAETKDIVYIGKDFPSEFAFSKYSKSLNRSSIKTKANLIKSLPILIENASNKSYKQNLKNKHISNASQGWYKYSTNFAFPIYNNEKQVIRYNIYKALLIVRLSNDNKLYLYDVINIFKK